MYSKSLVRLTSNRVHKFDSCRGHQPRSRSEAGHGLEPEKVIAVPLRVALRRQEADPHAKPR